jgi:PadR family transcriptional regulator, regulatory protein PadR
MDTQLKKGVLEMVVLSFLDIRDYYTYELNKTLSDFVQLNESTAYAVFKKLINQGYCQYYIQESEAGPARKYYKITPKGRAELGKMKTNWYEFASMIDDLLKKKDQTNHPITYHIVDEK